jgi:outer membrane autotransporter protein
VAAEAGGSVVLLSGSSVTTMGRDAPGLFATSAGSTIAATNTVISATGAGFDTVGAWATSGGAITLSSVSVTSSGDGLEADSGSSLSAANTTVRTTGDNVVGVLANNGVVHLTGGSVTTSGLAAHGLQATAGSNALITADGLTVNAAGSGVIVGNGATMMFQNGSITSVGPGAQAFAAGTATLGNSALTTTGDGSIGLLSTDPGSTIGASGLTVNTAGQAAHGVTAQNSGQVVLSGQNTIVTVGNGAIGMLADGAGASVTSTGNLTISTGTASTPGGAGVEANDGGAVNLQGVTINTGGNHALSSFGSNSTLSASDFNLTTTGPDAFGSCACDESQMQLRGGSIHTTGDWSFGLYAGGISAGLGRLIASNVSITTDAFSAHGAAVSAGGNLTLSGGTIVTQGTQAFGLLAWGPSQLAANGATVTTHGDAARGLAVLDGGVAELHDVTLRSTGIASNALYSYAFGTNSATSMLVDGGSLSADQSAAIRISGATAAITIKNGARVISGTGRLVDVLTLGGVPGQLTLTADGESLSGDIFVDAASGSKADVVLHNNTVLTGAVVGASNMVVDPSRWNVTGNSTLTGTLTNGGIIQFSPPAAASTSSSDSVLPTAGSASTFITGAPNGSADTVLAPTLASNGFKTLTVGSYVGNDGTLGLNTQLGADGSPTDRMIINGGSANGQSGLRVTNVGGTGGVTVTDGIMVVQATNGATTTASAFSLPRPVMAGAYTYYLFKGGVSAGTADNWYLRSSVAPVPTPTLLLTSAATATAAPVAADGTPQLPPPPPAGSAPTPLYRIEVPVYAEVPVLARELNIAQIGTFHDRQGEQSLLSETGALPAAWARTWGEHATQRNDGAVNPEFSGTMGGVQIGQDVYADATSTGHRNHYGFFVGFARATGDVSEFALGFPDFAAGHLSINAYSLGGYWTHVGPGGWYTDAVVTGSSLTIDPVSNQGIAASTHGHAVAASFEAGLPIPLSANLSVEPQAQLVWQNVSVNDLDDGISNVSFHGASGLAGRLGVRLQGRFDGAGTVWQPYLRANLWRYFGGTDSATFAGTTVIPTSVAATVAQFGFGVVARVSTRGSVFATAAYATNVNGAHRSIVGGDVGVRWSW